VSPALPASLKTLLVLLLIGQTTFIADARAWGPDGHSIVAEIAQRRLSPVAVAKVQDLLGANASLASIASWADDVREARPETRNWHFVNIPLADAAYDPARQCVQDERKGDCILNELDRAIATLADLDQDKARRTEALMFVVHFVGDLHQPLHTVLEDQGGNFFPVRFFTDPTGRRIVDTQLHKVWDVGLIDYLYWNWGAYVSYLVGTWLPAHQDIDFAAGKPADWMLESHRIASQSAYAGLARGMQLDAAYVARVRPDLDRQLAAAGVRLASVLNNALR